MVPPLQNARPPAGVRPRAVARERRDKMRACEGPERGLRRALVRGMGGGQVWGRGRSRVPPLGQLPRRQILNCSPKNIPQRAPLPGERRLSGAAAFCRDSLGFLQKGWRYIEEGGAHWSSVLHSLFCRRHRGDFSLDSALSCERKGRPPAPPPLRYPICRLRGTDGHPAMTPFGGSAKFKGAGSEKRRINERAEVPVFLVAISFPSLSFPAHLPSPPQTKRCRPPRPRPAARRRRRPLRRAILWSTHPIW